MGPRLLGGAGNDWLTTMPLHDHAPARSVRPPPVLAAKERAATPAAAPPRAPTAPTAAPTQPAATPTPVIPAWARVEPRQSDSDGGGRGGQDSNTAPSDWAESEQLADAVADAPDGDCVFELLLADGQAVRLALCRRGSKLSVLLSTDNAALRSELLRRRTELTAALKRRMGEHVHVAVL